jgi:peptidoglycan/LPS O-acetylase OafA/YrhL
VEGGKGEIRPLTGLRGVAASVVMLYHFFLDNHDVSMPIGRGYLAVDLFFVLSGFVMALSYGPLFAGRLTSDIYRGFLGRRIARVYPLLFVVTAVALVKYLLDFSGGARLAYAGYGPLDLAATLLMVQAWGFNLISMPGATWSISTEFFAYLIFPVLIFVSANPKGVFPALMIAVSVLGILLCAASPYGTVGPLDITTRDSPFPLIRCLSGFCLGLVAYRLARNESVRRRIASGWVTSLVVCGIGCMFLMHVHDIAVVFLYPLLVANLYYNNAVAARVFGNRVVHFIGKISYSVYLVHPLLAPAFRRAGGVLAAHVGNIWLPLVLLLYILAVFVVSFACFRAIENPGRKYAMLLYSRLN